TRARNGHALLHYSARPSGGLSEPSPARLGERAKVPLPLHRSDERSGFCRGSRDFGALPATCLRLPRRSTQLQSAIISRALSREGALERSSTGWTVGTFARPRARSASERSEYRGDCPVRDREGQGGRVRPQTKSERAKVPLPLHPSDERS